MKVITQIYLIRAQAEVSNPTTVTQYNLFFVTDHLQQKQLDDTDGDVSNKYLLFRSYQKQPPEVFYVK